MSRQRLTILGATGSIGVNTLDIVRRHPDRYDVFALCAHRQVDKLFEQICEFRPQYAVVGSAENAQLLSAKCRDAGVKVDIAYGVEALVAAASDSAVDAVMAAIVGAAGLDPTLAAARAGKKVMLANKEVLVMAGELFMAEVRRHKAVVLPVDSEHNAIFQSLPADFADKGLAGSGVRRILLTASGGPFRTRSLSELENVTPDQACAHPNWSMGRKISVDSASMMNKGLEVIEAHWLFNATADQIQVVVHPQSVIHSLVDYVDGSVLAQLGQPDMRTPIAYSLAYPERIDSGVEALDLFRIGRLDFEAPDFARFPCLRLAFDALRTGGTAPTVLNAANEVAVDAFLNARLPFLGIAKVIETCLERLPCQTASELDVLREADAAARQLAASLISETCTA